MNRILLPLFVLLIAVSCETNTVEHEDQLTNVIENSEMPKELAKIPDGIVVEHSKDTVYAEFNEEDPDEMGKYKWHYETTVKSIEEDLTIVEFGAYSMFNGEWINNTIYGRHFNNLEFSNWYKCPNGVLIKDSSYTDFNNWAKGNGLDGKVDLSLWYYIGTNNEGEKFKGVKKIITVGELKNR